MGNIQSPVRDVMTLFRSNDPFLVKRSTGFVQLMPAFEDCSIQILASASALPTEGEGKGEEEEAGCCEWNKYNICKRGYWSVWGARY